MQALQASLTSIFIMLAVYQNAWYIRCPAIAVAVLLIATVAIDVTNVLLRKSLLKDAQISKIDKVLLD